MNNHFGNVGIAKNMDRVLVSHSLIDNVGMLHSYIFSLRISYHFPIMLELRNDFEKIESPFKI